MKMRTRWWVALVLRADFRYCPMAKNCKNMKGREKCSLNGTVKFTLVTSNLEMRKVTGMTFYLKYLLMVMVTAVRTPASQVPVRDQVRI